MFLLVRDLLSDGASPREPSQSSDARSVNPDLAAFVAGLIFAFVPFRIAQVAHIQSLHSYWMPLALYGLRRFIVSGRVRPLVGGAAALLMQNWSNGYYLIFFAPFVPLFVIHQLWVSGRLLDGRRWLSLAVAAIVVALGTWPFLTLYLETQRVHGFERPLGEIVRYSADVYSYLTAPEALRLWGGVMQAFPKPEGELFFGLVPWALFAIAIATVRSSFRGTPQPEPVRWRRWLRSLLLAIIVIQTLGIIAIFFTGGFITSVAGLRVRATNSSRLMWMVALASTLLLAFYPAARGRALRMVRSPLTLCAVFVVLAIWLSLGPLPQSRGQLLPGVGLYAVLYENVPGFAGLRVPARYAMIAALFLSVVAGFGVFALMRYTRRATLVAALVGGACLVEAAFVPMAVNLTWGSSHVDAPPRVYERDDAPAVYHQLAKLREDAVVAEFPFGDTTWELRYVYYSTVHWRRLVNGYSGGFPARYAERAAVLQRVGENPDAAWRTLRDAGTTHVVVHERAFRPGESAVVTKWLSDHFAVEIARFDGDVLFDVTGVWPPK
jgi:hypothetical protein